MAEHRRVVGHTNAFYQPKQGDIVIGIVDRRVNDDWTVDIGFSHNAYLPGMAFDGVTKKSAPKFDRGEIVVCYVEDVPDAGEVLLSCVARTDNEKLGRLNGGTVLRLRPCDTGLLDTIRFAQLVGEKTKLQMAKGMNGRVWFDTGSAITTVQLLSVVNSALMSEDPAATFKEGLEKINFK